MRIDAYLPSYSPDRGPRSGTAVTPYREAQREIEVRREQPTAPASSQGLEQAPQIRRVQASSANTDSLPARSQDLAFQQPAMSNRAAQALASYSTTAAYANESDAQEVLGLDLYA
ncbi:hypothetical protein [Ectopseudomonas hydrolytica]|jgi:hypothetical protein|uniref:Uncharacterized protein n=2 Tax=Ectopseudomonas TaxID=3236654 RepID=A4XXP2_ECTM1|nr:MULTISPECIES: hypothetical protein [Pseudomonas]ARS50160.1 hypothetical protein PSMEN_17850 [Pseudomonas mendocina]EJO92615.1 hypothetical protein A471_17163 [Pseudomonas mendocina DLHK]ATH81070.1 hypothetical protein CO724_07855 [Pseudomonas mendocina]MBA4244506.1 hypothetical protein [Pseudomonas sp.]MBF8161772.1 hypothetical protein [Pseudomonas mendocina]